MGHDVIDDVFSYVSYDVTLNGFNLLVQGLEHLRMQGITADLQNVDGYIYI